MTRVCFQRYYKILFSQIWPDSVFNDMTRFCFQRKDRTLFPKIWQILFSKIWQDSVSKIWLFLDFSCYQEIGTDEFKFGIVWRYLAWERMFWRLLWYYMIIMTRIMWLLLTIEWFIYWQLLDALINPSCNQEAIEGGGTFLRERAPSTTPQPSRTLFSNKPIVDTSLRTPCPRTPSILAREHEEGQKKRMANWERSVAY